MFCPPQLCPSHPVITSSLSNPGRKITGEIIAGKKDIVGYDSRGRRAGTSLREIMPGVCVRGRQGGQGQG